MATYLRTASCPAPAIEQPPVPRQVVATDVPRVGVEEEFFLVTAETGEIAPRATQVMAEIGSGPRGLVQREFTTCQIEIASTPHLDLRLLRREMAESRAWVAAAARRTGCRLIASGTVPFASAGHPALTDDPRYLRMAGEYGAVARGESCCGCHVHVEVPDREEAVQVCNHLRPWLPILLALTANSPFACGGDSGYASWRAMALTRWPSVGFPPYLRSADDYEATLAVLLESGVIMDRAMVYWLVRPSDHVPTVEIRVADVCATVQETVLLAAVVRALVARALRDIRAGLPAPSQSDTLLHAAYWRAARDGLEGWGLEVNSARLAPAWQLADDLLRHIRQTLFTAGDLAMVTRQLARLRRVGSGAARQRAAYARRRDPHDVISLLSRQTAPKPRPGSGLPA